MNPLNKTLSTANLLLCAFALIACEGADQKRNHCLDRAAEQCAPVARDECGLSSSASDARLDQCRAYAACKNTAILSCMSQR